jgi:DNA-binding PadR family transcriptional regulator
MFPMHMAVLGLVVERPRQTVGWYAKALTERFPEANFGKPAAYKALRQMSPGSNPRVVCTHEEPGEDRSLDRYEATATGRAELREWMFRPPAAIPAVRQAMYGRVGLARLDDLPSLILILRKEEKIATSLYAEANAQLRKHEIMRKSESGERKTRAEFERAMRETWLYVGPMHWSSRARLCMEVIEHLEEIAQEAGIAIPDEDEDGEYGEADAG